MESSIYITMNEGNLSVKLDYLIEQSKNLFNIQPLDYTATKGDKFYFLPGVNIPRAKVKTFNDENGTKTVRDLNTATYIFGSDKSQHEYFNSHTKVKIICPIHGEFEQVPYDHVTEHGCNKCTTSVSGIETEINDFILSKSIKTITSSMSIIKPNQLDIYIPSHKIAIEFDGLYWHSELHKDKNYHLNKTELCEAKDIQLIHIFEDEWIYKKDIVKSRLNNILGLTENKIYARKCIIKEVSSKNSKLFMDENHIQGYTNSSVKLGLYYNDELISLMLFSKPRLGVGVKHDGYELTRFCNKLNTNVIGGASKLLKYFINNYKPKQIISYADRRWSQGGLYERLGFNQISINKPNYSYIIGKTRKHRFGFRKDILIKEGYDSNKTEHEIMLERRIYRIYDCGTITYKLICI